MPATRIDGSKNKGIRKTTYTTKIPGKWITNLLLCALTDDTVSVSWMQQYDLFPSDTDVTKPHPKMNKE